MSLDETAQLPATELSALIAKRAVSPIELTQTYIDRAKRYARLNAYITLDEEGALAQAKAAEAEIAAGRSRGPLHGLPVAIKDQLDVAGVRTTAGSKLVDYVATEDSTAVAKLREAGAIILGKLNMSEFALGGNITHPYGVPHNPWDETRQAGQSSSGSGIAVAASLCAAALGGDTAGSIRGPAAWCGITGIRPTWGRVSRYGTWPLAWFFDTIGPMTKTVADCAMVFEAIAGHDTRDPMTLKSADRAIRRAGGPAGPAYRPGAREYGGRRQHAGGNRWPAPGARGAGAGRCEGRRGVPAPVPAGRLDLRRAFGRRGGLRTPTSSARTAG